MGRFQAASATPLLTTLLLLAMLPLFTVESFAFKRMMLLDIEGHEQPVVHGTQLSKLAGHPKAFEKVGGTVKCDDMEVWKEKCEVDSDNEFDNSDYIYTNFKPGH